MEAREPDAGHLVAVIWPRNTASQALFSKAGYRLSPVVGQATIGAIKTRSA